MTVPATPTDGGSYDGSRLRQIADGFDLEEFRRRNRVALGMDGLYLVTIGFFANMFVRGVWPAAIAAIPMAALLYFGWSSSKPFFLAQLLTIAVVATATVANVVPL